MPDSWFCSPSCFFLSCIGWVWTRLVPEQANPFCPWGKTLAQRWWGKRTSQWMTCQFCSLIGINDERVIHGKSLSTSIGNTSSPNSQNPRWTGYLKHTKSIALLLWQYHLTLSELPLAENFVLRWIPPSDDAYHFAFLRKSLPTNLKSSWRKILQSIKTWYPDPLALTPWLHSDCNTPINYTKQESNRILMEIAPRCQESSPGFSKNSQLELWRQLLQNSLKWSFFQFFHPTLSKFCK